MIAVGAYGFAYGEPDRLLYPTDSNGSLCGKDEYADRPNLFFFDLLKCLKMGASVVTHGCPTPQVCVAECPSSTWTWYKQEFDEKLDSTKKADRAKYMFCKEGVNPQLSSKSLNELIEDGDCAPYTLPSKPIVGRCIPEIKAEFFEKLQSYNVTVNSSELEDGRDYLAIFLNAQEYGMKILQDVRASWHMCLVGLAMAMVLSFIWIVLMRWIAGVMVWVTLVLFVGIFGFATYYTIDKYLTLKDDSSSNTDVKFVASLDYYKNLSKTWLALAIICGTILGITLILLIFLRTRILIAISVIKSASRAVGSMIFTLFWPLIPFLLQVILFAYWGAAAIFLASSGSTKQYSLDPSNASEIVQNSLTEVAARIPCDPNKNSTLGSVCNFVKYGGDEYTAYLQYFMLFMLFWVMNFIVALGQVTLAGAFASYYWTMDKSNLVSFPVAKSLWRALRYHLGSIAFGSLIIAIIQMIRVLLEYVETKLKSYDNDFVKYLLKCLKCCFWCLEKFMKFINKNAYIMVALYGKNFCTSAKKAFFLLMRNIVRVVVIDKVTDFILFISKLVVVGIVGIVAFIFFSGDAKGLVPIDSISDYTAQNKPELNYYLIPVIIIVIGTYVIASGFFNVYNMGVDTIFLCFLEDEERNDGSADKPYYMSSDLKGILGKKNKSDETD
ncbi:hypothetical protein NP493_45g04048 [Ridgeia piscesae]|uniref:Choline transporter-like protein n=1 Tax=Ridgeia piscesae TaxID=27915 RepID=A0AAD9UJP6_RIDPI|nr:hypothetical protein NP493_45g04048 [Ridgeia piscesae]